MSNKMDYGLNSLANRILKTCNGENSGLVFLALLAVIDHLLNDKRHDYEMLGMMREDLTKIIEELDKRLIN